MSVYLRGAGDAREGLGRAKEEAEELGGHAHSCSPGSAHLKMHRLTLSPMDDHDHFGFHARSLALSHRQ